MILSIIIICGLGYVTANIRQWLGRSYSWHRNCDTQHSGAVGGCLERDDYVRAVAERCDDLASSTASFCLIAIVHCVDWRHGTDIDEFKADGIIRRENLRREREAGARGGTRTPTS